MKVIMIGGYPGVGKSTIMKGAIAKLEKEGYKFSPGAYDGTVKFMYSRGLVILGSYEKDEKFPGTDRLPMNVQPKVEKFLYKVAHENPNATIIMEGDRLFNDKMIKFIRDSKMELILCIVSAKMELVEERRQSRSEQNEQWRKGRQTKVDRIAMSYPIHHSLLNSTEVHQNQSIAELTLEILGAWTAEKPPKAKISSLWE